MANAEFCPLFLLWSSMAQLKPIGDRVVVVRNQSETVKNGIIIPENSQKKSTSGRVIAVGEKRLENGEVIPLSVAVGDNVLFNSYAGTEVKVDDKDYLVMAEADILAVFEN